MFTYNNTLPNTRKIVINNWETLKINIEFHEAFQSKPTIEFKRNKNLHEIIGGYKNK